MTLEGLIARLARHAMVDGVLLIGSTATSALTPTSDFDLVLVLTELPVPMNMVTTWVAGRFTEVQVTTTAALARIVDRAETWSSASEEGAVLFWLQTGRVVYDRTGNLGRAQVAARQAPSPAPTAGEAYGAWRHIGYSVVHMRRYLASAEPTSQIAVDLRLLYGLSDVMVGYFTVRRIPWRGEKAAIRFWQEHDPDFLSRLQACLAETDRRSKVACYEEVARRALAPMGDAWEVGTTTVAPGAGYGTGEPPPAGTIEDALGFWRQLTGEAVDHTG